jgi:THO complex subunit 2
MSEKLFDSSLVAEIISIYLKICFQTEDGVNVSQWLQSLETFSGAFFKRCAFVEFRGILCYLMRRLKDGNVMELGILRTLLKVPGGYSFIDYSPAASLSVSQLVGRAGSITLKRETMSFGIVEEVNHGAAEKIRQVLQTDGFGVSMLILISQVRSRVLFDSSSGSPREVKLVGNLYDSCQVVISILLEFLTGNQETKGDKGRVNTSILEYAEHLPSMKELHTIFGCDVASTWMLCRPLVQAATQATSEDLNISQKLRDFSMSAELRSAYKSLLPESIWSSISSELFEIFYANNLHDIFCPDNAYKSEISRVTKEIERIESRLKAATPVPLHSGPGSQRNDSDELQRLKSVSQQLESDLSRQDKHVQSIADSMSGRKIEFFKSAVTLEDSARTFLVQCTFPRSTQSPDDALYCAHFVSQLHKMETPGFSTLHYIDELISVVSGSFFGVTEGEAANFAILLLETWNIVNKWRYEEEAFNQEVLGREGSCMSKPGVDIKKGIRSTVHKEFVALYNTWHASLGAALMGCLQSSEYMHTRAGLVVLTRLVEVFPTRPKLGNKLLQVLAPLQDESSSRPDIRASANAYGMMLLKARDEGKWIEEDAAVAKARAEKEMVAAEKRKRKIAQQFQEMKRDSEKITEEIGSRDGIKDRHDRRREARDYPSSRGGPELDRFKSSQQNDSRENGKNRSNKEESYSKSESGEISGRDPQDRDRRPFSRPSSPSRRDRPSTDERIHSRNDAIGSPSGRQSERRHGSDSRKRDEGLGGRWQRGEAAPSDSRPRGGKRSRAPSPAPGNDGNRGDRLKRPRLDESRRSSTRRRQRR